jgi:transposase
MATASSTAWYETRRYRAWELSQHGWKSCEIAEALGVTRGTVSQWLKRARQHGVMELAAVPRTGAPRRLCKQALWLWPDLLSYGAEAYGFRGDLWTCSRVRRVIQQEFDVTYDRRHISRLLKQIGWTPHKPMVRAGQRNVVAIRAWREQTWPEVKEEHVWSAGNWCSSLQAASEAYRCIVERHAHFL